MFFPSNGFEVTEINGNVMVQLVQKLPNLFPSSDPGRIGFTTCDVWSVSEPRRIMIDKIIFKFCVVVVIL